MSIIQIPGEAGKKGTKIPELIFKLEPDQMLEIVVSIQKSFTIFGRI